MQTVSRQPLQSSLVQTRQVDQAGLVSIHGQSTQPSKLYHIKQHELTARTWHSYTKSSLNFQSCLAQTILTEQANLVSIHGQSPRPQSCIVQTTQVDNHLNVKSSLVQTRQVDLAGLVSIHGQSTQPSKLYHRKQHELTARTWHSYTKSSLNFQSCLAQTILTEQANLVSIH